MSTFDKLDQDKNNKNYINILLSKTIDENSTLYKRLNENSKERLIMYRDLDVFAKATTHFIFRNGPVEDIHTNGHLTQKDMKALNKYMVNQLALLFELLKNEEWLKLGMLFDYYKQFGTDWDKAELDYSEVDLIFKTSLEIQILEYFNKMENDKNTS